MNLTFTGLGTMSIPVQAAGYYTVSGKLTLPTISEGLPSNSQVVVTVNISGGAAIYTGVAGAEGFMTGGSLTAGQVFNVILTSSSPVDLGLNVIKTTVSVF